MSGLYVYIVMIMRVLNSYVNILLVSWKEY